MVVCLRSPWILGSFSEYVVHGLGVSLLSTIHQKVLTENDWSYFFSSYLMFFAPQGKYRVYVFFIITVIYYY